MTEHSTTTSHNGTRHTCVQHVYGPDLFGPCETTNRYQVEEAAFDYVVRDTHNGELVLTASGNYYVAPLENAQWTADRLNSRNDWQKTGQ